MPTIIRAFNYHIYFWSNEGKPLEPIHVHVSRQLGEKSLKIWINSDGTAEIAENNSDIPIKDINRLLKTIEEFSEKIIKDWKEYFKEEPTFNNLINPSKTRK